MFLFKSAEVSSEDILMSLGRALEHMPDLTDQFYKELLSNNEEIRLYFKNTDFNKQKHLLHGAISMVVMFDAGDETAVKVLADIRRTHNRKHMNIRPELYGVWEECFISLISRADTECDSTLEKEWRRIVSKATKYISDGY